MAAHMNLDLTRLIHDTLQEAIHTTTEEIVQEATKQFQKRLRSEIAKQTLEVDNFFTAVAREHELVITIKRD